MQLSSAQYVAILQALQHGATVPNQAAKATGLPVRDVKQAMIRMRRNNLVTHTGSAGGWKLTFYGKQVATGKQDLMLGGANTRTANKAQAADRARQAVILRVLQAAGKPLPREAFTGPLAEEGHTTAATTVRLSLNALIEAGRITRSSTHHYALKEPSP